MTRALVSFGSGPFTELLELARPGFEQYADRHGYDLNDAPLGPAIQRLDPDLERPPSWWKIPLLLAALDQHDEALWVDADTVVVDDTEDLADEVPARAWQAITVHHTPEGEVPSAGVWYVRQQARTVLEAIWSHDEYLHHRWWEQAALQHLLGYTPNEVPVRLDRPTEVYRHTHWLGLEWNTLAFPGRPVDPAARIVHAAPGYPVPVRAQLMSELTPVTKGA